MYFLGLATVAVGQRSQLRRQGRDKALEGYSAGDEELLGAYSNNDEALADDPLGALANNIPGVPGEDYPIYDEVPETAFVCDGQVDGGNITIIDHRGNKMQKNEFL